MSRTNNNAVDWTKSLKYNCNDDLTVTVLGKILNSEHNRIIKLGHTKDYFVEYYMVVNEHGHCISGRDSHFYSVENRTSKMKTVWHVAYVMADNDSPYIANYNYERAAKSAYDLMIKDDRYKTVSPIWSEAVEDN